MPDTVNLTFTEDDDSTATFLITSGDEALGLASATVFAVVKPDQQVEDDAATAHTLTEGDGITIVDAAAGTVRLDFPAAVTETPSVWYYKVRVSVDGETQTAITGWIFVQDS